MFGLLDVAVSTLGRVAATLVSAAVLLHVVLAGKGLVALGAESILLASVLLCVAGSMARGGKEVVALELLGHRARIAVLLGSRVQGGGVLVLLGELFGPEVACLRGVGVVGERARLVVHGEAEILLVVEESILREDGRVHAGLVGKVWSNGRGRLHVGV